MAESDARLLKKGNFFLEKKKKQFAAWCFFMWSLAHQKDKKEMFFDNQDMEN